MTDVIEELLEEVIGDVRRARIEDPDAKETLIHLKGHHQRQVTQEQPPMEQEGLHQLLRSRPREHTRFPRRR